MEFENSLIDIYTLKVDLCPDLVTHSNEFDQNIITMPRNILGIVDQFYSKIDYANISYVAVACYFDKENNVLAFRFLTKFHIKPTEAKNEINFYLFFALLDEYINIPPPIHIFLLVLIIYQILRKQRYEIKNFIYHKKE